ncbi:MAG: type I 3-dehydroquinate dehydratase [Natronincolaceae bacterium]|jgi:3-dehydroquinate dehydratase-1|nr:type I 3-dehydroquinate dehydratase [Bacillota bacterium]NLK90368.1 type I 3-dehydroquinate dehydratase [Clostridiales bacterium]
MKKVVTTKGVKIGEGLPKICVPIVGKTIEEILEETRFLKTADFDIAEWRADFYDDIECIDRAKLVLEAVRYILMDDPIIFTFRNVREGGKRQISTKFYFELNMSIIQTRIASIVDIELSDNEREIKTLIDAAHKNNVAVIISSHDFEGTPPKEEIISRLRKAAELGGDILKIAVMPTCEKDIITLLDATRIMKEKYKDRPIATISMGRQGIISRLAGGLFGSDLTFASVGGISAPGQISSEELRRFMSLLYDNSYTE